MSSIRLQLSRLSVVTSLLALSFTAPASLAQVPALATPRVLDAVNASQTVPLTGNTLPLAQTRFDHGLVPDSTPTGHMMVVLKRSDAQEQALKQLMGAQQDPASPSFHKWLTPESFGAQFGVADSDVQAVSTYLASEGFTVGRVFKSKMAIEFSGTTGQVRSSFKTEIHNYVVNGQSFRANATAPSIPAALAPVVRGFASMNNYKSPAKQTSQRMLLNRKTGLAQPLYADGNGQVESVSPGDLATIYDIPTSTYDGTGVTVGIISDSNINVAIPANYRTTFGLATNPPTVVVDGNDPGIIPSDVDATYGEIELVAATAPAAKVNVYTSATTLLDSGLDFAAIRALEDNTAQVLVFGYEACEADLGQVNGLFSAIWEQAAAQGISAVVGSGSGGSAQCDAVTNGGLPPNQASRGLAVNGYASTPYNTAVGTSDFYYGPAGTLNPNDLSSFAQYWSTTNGDTSYTSAKSYIPEQPNNYSDEATNQIQQSPSFVFASGGGISTLGLVNDDGTQTFYPQPTYQMGFSDSVPGQAASAPARVIPDVSIFGGINNGSVYISCADPADCVNGSPASLQYTGFDGTGAAAAAFGGIAALVVQAKGPQGNLNPALYATSAAAPTAFHDITAGTNTVQCSSGSPDCGGTYLQSGGMLAYQAKTGYDAASGLGSVDVAKLIQNWKTPTGVATVSISFNQNGQTYFNNVAFHHGDPVQLNVKVTGSGKLPTGDVAITTSSPQAGGKGVERLTLANGAASDSAIGNILVGSGSTSYQLTARYAGDANYAPATSSVAVTVYQVPSTLVLLSTDQQNKPLPVTYTGQPLPYGTPVQFTFQVYEAGNKNDGGTPSGAVAVFDNNNQIAAVPINSEGFATFASTTLAPGSHSFTATYAGDNTYGSTSLTGAAPSLVISGAPTVTAIGSSDFTPSSRNATFQLLASVTSTAGSAMNPVYGASPSGTVRFTTSTGSLLGSANLNLGTNATASPVATAVFTVARRALPAGTTAVIATFVPNTSNYAGSTSSPLAISVGAATGYVNTTLKLATTPANAVNFLNTGSLSFTATLTAANGAAVSSGTVGFIRSDGVGLGSANVTGGVATFPIPFDGNGNLLLPLGQSVISAEYVDSSSTYASSSASYTVNVYSEGTTPDFSMQSDPTYQVVSSSSKTATFSVQFTSLNGLAAVGTPIALSYKTPAGITCSGAPTAPNFNGGTSANVMVSCGPSAGSTIALNVQPKSNTMWIAEGSAALACIFLFGMPSRRRSWQSLIGAMAVIVVAFGVTGCGVSPKSGSSNDFLNGGPSGGGSSTSSVTIAPGSYDVIMTGTARVFVKAQPNVTVTVVHNLPLRIVVK